jgi:hypothetical protein
MRVRMCEPDRTVCCAEHVHVRGMRRNISGLSDVDIVNMCFLYWAVSMARKRHLKEPRHEEPVEETMDC